MKLVIRSVLLAFAFLAGACTHHVSVLAPDMTGDEFSPQTKTPGHFAVMIPSGAWHIEVKTDVEACTVLPGDVTFPTDLDTGYAQAAGEGFAQAFESVVIITTALKPEQLKTQKLDAQIMVSQGGITANASDRGPTKNILFMPIPMVSAVVNSTVALEGAVAVMGPDGAVNPRTIKASGSYAITKSDNMCKTTTPLAIDMAGSAAIKEFVLNAINAAKLDVMALKGKKAPAEPVN